jgi:hypothetical protein
MKRLVVLFTIIIPYFGFSQVDGSKIMDFNNIDYRFLDSLIIDEINEVRDSLGHLRMHYSRIVSENISNPRCQKLKNEQKVYHPDGRIELYTEKLESSIIRESLVKYKFKGGVDLVDGFEICLFKTKTYKLITYGDVVKSIVDLWETSPDHCFVIRDAYNQQKTETDKEVFLMSGVSTKYGTYNGRNGFYAVLNLTVIYKY